MDNNIAVFRKYLCAKYPNLKDIVKSFELCSAYNNKTMFLVNSQVKTINFDKLTEWAGRTNGVKSADSLSFSDNHVYLIEFKSGDPTTAEKKFEKLIENVIDKINDSNDTLVGLYKESSVDGLDQIFCLIVDSKKMKINPLVSVLITRSLIDNFNPKEKQILEQLQPQLTAGVHIPNHYSKIEIWYSEIFDTYLSTRKITDFYIT